MKSWLPKLLIGLAIVFLSSNGQFVSAEGNLQNETSVLIDDDVKLGVTRRAFDAMKIGMTRRQVNRIIGFSGTVLTSSKGGGKVFSSYKWEGKRYAIITAVFEDDVLTNKYEANLE